MSNPFFNTQQANNQTGKLDITSQAVQQAKTIMQNMNSPQMQFIRSYLSGNKMSAQQAVEMLCKQSGIDMNEFMNQISKFMKQ